ncbi:MAG: S41 family peptidase, partial [Planctomycetota bacterium]|nr:S41 family peptidase [Planctomycetota bacterium]
KIVFDGANELVLVDVATGKATKLGYNVAGGYSVSEFSRDGKWLVLTKSDADRNSDVYLHEIATGTQHNVTKHPARDSGGRLTPDGKTVVFTSRRNGESSQLFAVSLKKLTKDPKDPLNQPARRSRTSRRGGRGARPEGGGSADRSIRSSARNTTPLTIAIDADDIDRRAVALTPSSGSVGSYFLSRDGKTVYYTAGSSRFGFGRRRSEVKEPNLQRRRRQRPTQTPTQRPTQRPTQTPSPRQTRGMPGAQSGSSGSGLWSVGLDGDNRKKVTDGSFRSLAVTPDKSAVFFSDREGIYKLALSTRKKEQVKFELKVKVDNHAEWEQVFEESWRSMKYRFYDKDMHGFDWDAIKARYKPYLAYVGSNEDLSQLANEMIGELNASHVGVRSSPSRSMDRVYQTRLLGFEMSPGAQHYTVSHIYRDGPSDKEWIDLANGDQVLAMNGQPVAAGDNYWKILNETLNDYVTVRIARNGKEHNIRVRPTTSLSNIKYREWVHQNTKFVEKETAGEIAYCHIRSMSQTSLRQFEREISQYWNKKGIVIDIRYNGGGNIDEPLLDILERRPYAYVNQRWGARTWGRRHSQTVAGPKVMMINERSFSDAEMTPMGFKNLELGRLVGTPTGAGVIWTGSYRLINGSRIRTPGSLAVTYDPSKPNNYGINLENFGVEPDVWVENSPRDELDGNDRQLKAAIAEVRRMLGKGSWQHATHQGNGANDRK